MAFVMRMRAPSSPPHSGVTLEDLQRQIALHYGNGSKLLTVLDELRQSQIALERRLLPSDTTHRNVTSAPSSVPVTRAGRDWYDEGDWPLSDEQVNVREWIDGYVVDEFQLQIASSLAALQAEFTATSGGGEQYDARCVAAIWCDESSTGDESCQSNCDDQLCLFAADRTFDLVFAYRLTSVQMDCQLVNGFFFQFHM
jgi:hypothetical protein